MDEKMIALLYLISLGVFFLFLVIATIAFIAGSIKRKKKNKNQDVDEHQEEEHRIEQVYEKLDKKAAMNAVNDAVDDDDIFAEAVFEATQIANETAAQVAQPVQVENIKVQEPVQMTQPVQIENIKVEELIQEPVQMTQPIQPKVPVQPTQPVQPEIQVQPMQSVQPEVPVQPMQPVQPEAPVQSMQSVQPEVPVQSMQSVQPDIPVQPMQSLQPTAALAEEQFAATNMDSAFVDSAFGQDSAFADSAFGQDSAFADSAFTDSAFADSAFNNMDGNAFPGSAFETPTLVDPSAMDANAVSFTHGGNGQDPVGNFYWFNKEDVEDRPDYKPEEMYYRHFTTASQCIEDLLIEMYDCALVRTEEIRYIAYGIEPRHVALRDVAATGNAAYNAAKKKKEPTKEDLDKIYRKWCSYVDKLFEIVEFRADNTTIGIIRDKLYEFGKNDVDVLIEGK